MAKKENKKQRIAVASEGKGQDSEISLRGGRSPYYLVFEGKELVETIKNPFAVGGGGAGWSVAYMLADKKVDLVIAGRFGPNMEFALKEKKIKAKEASGKISKYLKLK
jgi:predicted Fe-Mo cluster-binding NifX family protein